MLDQHKYLIDRLKQQPRHGQKSEKEREMEHKSVKSDQIRRDELKALQKAVDAMKASSLDIDKIFSTLTTANSNLQAGIGRTIGVVDSFNKAIVKSIQNATFLEQANADLNKTFGITSLKAAEAGQRFDNLAVKFKVGGQKVRQYAKNLKSVADGFIVSEKANSAFNKQLLKGQKYMTTNLGVSEKAAAGYELYANLISDSGIEQLALQKNIAEGIEKRTGMEGVQKDLTETIGGLAENIQVQYGRIPGSLELGVLKARAMGLAMENLNAAGNSLLNIEQSIGNELEYQLLSGNRLIDNQGKSLTNAYREATLRGNASDQASILNQILEQEGDTLENNMIARQKMAELLGIDEATLSRSLQKKKILERIGGEALMDLTGDELAAAAGKIKGVAAEDLEDLMEADDIRTTDVKILDALNAQLAMMKGTDQKAVIKGTRDDMTKGVNKLLEQDGGLKGFIETMSSDKMRITIGTLQHTSDAFFNLNEPITKLLSSMPLFNTQIAGLHSTLTDKLTSFKNIGKNTIEETDADTSMDDGIIMNDGVIRFNPADKFMKVNDSTMIAGTNVDGNKKLARSINNGGVTKNDLNQLAIAIASAMKGVKLEVKAPSNLYGPGINGQWQG